MRRRNAGSHNSGCIEIPALVVLDRQRGECACPIGPGIDTDPVGTLVGAVADGMPVDDDEAMIAVVEQERLADPAQIGLALPVELDARTNSRMDAEVIAESAGIGKTTEELDVAGRDHLTNARQRSRCGCAGDRLRIGSVAFEALRPAAPEPAGDQIGLAASQPDQHLLMVAEQEDRPDPVVPVGPEALDHLRRARPTIDQIAKEYDERLGRTPRVQIAMNLVEQLVEQVEPAVDVADDIGALATGTARHVAS